MKPPRLANDAGRPVEQFFLEGRFPHILRAMCKHISSYVSKFQGNRPRQLGDRAWLTDWFIQMQQTYIHIS